MMKDGLCHTKSHFMRDIVMPLGCTPIAAGVGTGLKPAPTKPRQITIRIVTWCQYLFSHKISTPLFPREVVEALSCQ
jgi:hypothetical protein